MTQNTYMYSTYSIHVRVSHAVNVRSCTHFLFPVPAAAPLLNITSITAISIAVAWQPLPPCQENGVITSYTIAYRMEGGMDMTFTELLVPAASSTALVSRLTPYTNYTIKMAASTSAGRGEFGPEVAVLTSEAGTYVYI